MLLNTEAGKTLSHSTCKLFLVRDYDHHHYFHHHHQHRHHQHHQHRDHQHHHHQHHHHHHHSYWVVDGLILSKLVIVLFHYNVSLYELPLENKLFIITV